MLEPRYTWRVLSRRLNREGDRVSRRALLRRRRTHQSSWLGTFHDASRGPSPGSGAHRLASQAGSETVLLIPLRGTNGPAMPTPNPAAARVPSTVNGQTLVNAFVTADGLRTISIFMDDDDDDGACPGGTVCATMGPLSLGFHAFPARSPSPRHGRLHFMASSSVHFLALDPMPGAKCAAQQPHASP